MKTLHKAVAALALTIVSSPAMATTYVGSYWVGAGPIWYSDPAPAVLSAKEAAALIFGGSANDYIVSISSSTITGTAWVDGWGDTTHLKTDWFQSGGSSTGTPVDDDYSLGDSGGLYNYPAFSAYVSDHEVNTTERSPDASINYVFRIDSAVPEPASWAMMIAGFALAGATLRRRRPQIRFA